MKAMTDLTRADLKVVERLKRIAVRRCRANRRQKWTATKHPHCNRDDAHLLALIMPELVPECPECGEVWRGENLALINSRLSCKLAAEGAGLGGGDR